MKTHGLRDYMADIALTSVRKGGGNGGFSLNDLLKIILHLSNGEPDIEVTEFGKSAVFDLEGTFGSIELVFTNTSFTIGPIYGNFNGEHTFTFGTNNTIFGMSTEYVSESSTVHAVHLTIAALPELSEDDLAEPSILIDVVIDRTHR